MSTIRPVGPTVARKAATTAKALKLEMPPPPPIVPPPQPMLTEELAAMQSALQTSVVKAGEIFRFQADASRAGVSKHATAGPRGAAAALHRSIDRYQQAYDSLESHLLRALAVLEHDLEREKARIESKREAERALVASPPPMDETQLALSPATITAQASVSGLAARRPSTVSLSSLHHRAPPLRLDLSSVLPMSPVTLAPRTGAPHTSTADFAADFLLPPLPTGPVIDLTLGDAPPLVGPGLPAPGMGTSDHPIDVDMDADLFGDETQAATVSTGTQPEVRHSSEEQHLFTPSDIADNELFSTLTGDAADADNATAFLDALATHSTDESHADATAADSANLLAELLHPESGSALANDTMRLDPTMGADSLGGPDLSGMDMSGLDANLDASFFASDAMPDEMMELMNQLTSLTDTNDPTGGGS